ncbi:Hypothetical predicted protein [Paramuricea clavata]|uniref:Uncharacterized protein n=1 Tax=Paramuricea clavata TaxID=317549 RepID=A0A7D9EUP1_PARCT|nr:Hypothetical predicted protein [Paramuricea clavata]
MAEEMAENGYNHDWLGFPSPQFNSPESNPESSLMSPCVYRKELTPQVRRMKQGKVDSTNYSRGNTSQGSEAQRHSKKGKATNSPRQNKRSTPTAGRGSQQSQTRTLKTPSPTKTKRSTLVAGRGSQQSQQSQRSRPLGLETEGSQRHDGPLQSPTRAGAISNKDLLSELNKVKDDVGSLKRSMKEIASRQLEMMRVVKALKKSHESHNFEMGKCCHTRLLEAEFEDSPTGLSVQELMSRCGKYEAGRFSYWRSEERRRVLGLNGYEQLLEVLSSMLTNKVLQLLGQKYNVQSKSAVKKEIILIRKFIRSTSLESARKLKEFCGSFYEWRSTSFPGRMTSSKRTTSVMQRNDNFSCARVA